MAILSSMDFRFRPADGATGVAESVRNYTELQELVLCGDWFGDDDAEELEFQEALAQKRSLRMLRLHGTALGARGFRCIIEALKINAALMSLELVGSAVGDAGAAIISDLLSTTSSLGYLALFSVGIGAQGSIHIAKALEINKSLRILNFSSNPIGDDGAAAFADALAENSTLKNFFVSECGISALGWIRIARAVEANKSLQNINICGNAIGDAGAAALAQALAEHPSLKTVRAGSCGISELGSKAIAEALETNKSLNELFIGHNEIGHAGAAGIVNSLAATTALKILQVVETATTSEEGALVIARAWGENLTLPLDLDLVHGVASIIKAFIQEEAHSVRSFILRRREQLVAFGMAMLERLGGGTEDDVAPEAGSTIKECAFQSMDGDIFRLIGDAYGLYPPRNADRSCNPYRFQSTYLQ